MFLHISIQLFRLFKQFDVWEFITICSMLARIFINCNSPMGGELLYIYYIHAYTVSYHTLCVSICFYYFILSFALSFAHEANNYSVCNYLCFCCCRKVGTRWKQSALHYAIFGAELVNDVAENKPAASNRTKESLQRLKENRWRTEVVTGNPERQDKVSRVPSDKNSSFSDKKRDGISENKIAQASL